MTYQKDDLPRIENCREATRHWGTADQKRIWGHGIVQFWTPSHGGYELSAERMLLMPEHLRACSFTGDNAFEEDCSWCAVPLAFPDCFPADYVADAQRTYDLMYGERNAAA